MLEIQDNLFLLDENKKHTEIYTKNSVFELSFKLERAKRMEKRIGSAKLCAEFE